MVLLTILIVILPTNHFPVVSPVNKTKYRYIFKGNMRIVDTQENISPKTESGKKFICFFCNFCWHQMLISILSNDLSLSSIVLYGMVQPYTREGKKTEELKAIGGVENKSRWMENVQYAYQGMQIQIASCEFAPRGELWHHSKNNKNTALCITALAHF